MLHVKFPNYRLSGSEEKDFLNIFAIYSHGGNLGPVTMTIYVNFHYPYLTILHIKLGFIWPNGL